MASPETTVTASAVNDGDSLPLHQFLTYRLSRVQAKLNAQATRLLREQAGLTLSQWRIIALIGSAGQARPSELTSEGHFDKSLFSRKVKPLISANLVASTQDKTDHRAQILSLTPRGQGLYEATLPIMRKRQRELRKRLSPTELGALYSALDKLEIAADLTEFP